MARKKNLIQLSAEAPAILLDQSIQRTQKLATTLPQSRIVKKSGRYWHMLGPGLTTGASDDDPSGIATYSQAGAQFGFGLLWLSAWTFPLMSIVQEMCARIGLVTGRGLAGNIRIHYSHRVLYACTALLFFANALNIGADLGAMAKAVQLMFPQISFSLLVIGFTVFSLGLQIFTPYARYARYLKWLALVLFSYVASAIMANLNWQEVLHHAWRPSIEFSKTHMILFSAILGTTISPYLFFWQTSQEVEGQIMNGKTTLRSRRTVTAPAAMSRMRIDVWSGMLLSNAVMFFIIAASGAVLYPNGIREIQTAAQAAEALRPFAGNASFFLFALGIIGTGLLAIPVLSGASSYAIAESFHWREGLYRKLGAASGFYGIMIISMLVGLAINFLGIDPIKALIYSAVANGIVSPVILFLIIRMSSNKKIMGRWKNKVYVSLIGWAVTGLMVVSGIAAIYSLLVP